MLHHAAFTDKNKDDLIEIIHEKEKIIHEKENIISGKDTFIASLIEQIQLLKRAKFCAASERFIDDNKQGCLFDEATPPLNVEEIEEAEENILIPSRTRKPGRKKLPEDLPREQIIYDLPDDEKICQCGCSLICIGEEKTEQFEIIPAKLYVIEHIQKKYACKGCEETIKTAKKPAQPIPKSIASAGLLAFVLTQKFQFHLPLYRQEKMLQTIGIDIPRATLCLWVIRSAELLRPLVNLLQDRVLSYDVSFADETTVQVLKEDGKTAQSTSYMWCFAGGPPEELSYVYQYHPRRSHDIAIDFFAEFNGYLHCDGYQAYDTLSSINKNVTQVGCWYHVRRKFVDCAKQSKTSGLADRVLKLIQKLARIEGEMVSKKLLANDVVNYRRTHASLIIKDIKTVLDQHASHAPPQSLLGKAIHYALNQWPKLQTYLQDSRLEISNNRMERAMKPFAVGRKNWLFANSVEGAEAAGIIFSLIETCKAHQVHAYEWLRHALTHLPAATSVDQIEALLPFHFKKPLPDKGGCD
jgi:transposase